MARGVGERAREGAHVGLVVRGSAFFGFELPVGDGEFDGDVVERDENTVTVFGVELFRAVGVSEDCPRRLPADQTRPVSRAWFSPSLKRCSQPCMLPVRLSSVCLVHVQPSMRQRH
eukprot:scaffold9009_cov130-Isochrysis_galbana.AAC.1